MQVFSIYTPPATLRLSEDAENVGARFLSDGKSILALIVPVVWLIWHRLWFALGIYGLYAFALLILSRIGYDTLAVMLSALPGLFLLLEGRQLIERRMEMQGWIHQGIVLAANEEDAAERYFNGEARLESFEKPVRYISTENNHYKSGPAKGPNTNPLGLFPE